MLGAVVKSLSMALVLLQAPSYAAGDDLQIASSPISRPLGDADLVCSATILGTWRTTDSLDARGEVDKVFKGKLIRTKIAFRDIRGRDFGDLTGGPSVNANSSTLMPDLHAGTRYMLFLSSDSANGRRQVASTYRLEFSVPLAPGADARLRLDASKITLAEQKRDIVEELVKAANFVLDSHGNAADAYDYFSHIYELLGTDTMPFVQNLLDSADTRLRYFAADKLAQIDDESAVDPLLTVLNDLSLDAWMRATAAWDLAMLHASKTLPDFERLATDDPDATVRAAALRGLEELGDCNAAEVLVRALDDSVESNRQLAATLLKQINSGKFCKSNPSAP